MAVLSWRWRALEWRARGLSADGGRKGVVG
jgi:hypothetical protein